MSLKLALPLSTDVGEPQNEELLTCQAWAAGTGACAVGARPGETAEGRCRGLDRSNDSAPFTFCLSTVSTQQNISQEIGCDWLSLGHMTTPAVRDSPPNLIFLRQGRGKGM